LAQAFQGLLRLIGIEVFVAALVKEFAFSSVAVQLANQFAHLRKKPVVVRVSAQDEGNPLHPANDLLCWVRRKPPTGIETSCQFADELADPGLVPGLNPSQERKAGAGLERIPRAMAFDRETCKFGFKTHTPMIESHLGRLERTVLGFEEEQK